MTTRSKRFSKRTTKLTRLGKGGVLIAGPKPKKSWVGIVKTNLKVLRAPQAPKVTGKKIITPTKSVIINVKLEIPQNALDKAYPDILINFMSYLSEQEYLDFTASGRNEGILEDLSLTNSSFLEYLKRYRPKEAKEVLYREPHHRRERKVSPDYQYIYYDIHYELFSELYLGEKEKKELELEKKYGREEDILEYAKHLDDEDY